MNCFIILVTFVVSIACANANEWKPADFIAPADATKPVLIPREFSVSKFGKGKYRLDNLDSYGKVGCIFLFFESQDSQIAVPTEWKAIVDGTLPAGTIIMERTIRNPFEGTGESSTALLRIRVTGKDSKVSEQLTAIADSLIHK